LASTCAGVRGVDFSNGSIEYAKAYAKNEGRSIDYILQNYLDYASEERYDIIAMIMCDFCTLSPTQRKAVFENFHRLLKNNGCLLLDAY